MRTCTKRSSGSIGLLSEGTGRLRVCYRNLGTVEKMAAGNGDSGLLRSLGQTTKNDGLSGLSYGEKAQAEDKCYRRLSWAIRFSTTAEKLWTSAGS